MPWSRTPRERHRDGWIRARFGSCKRRESTSRATVRSTSTSCRGSDSTGSSRSATVRTRTARSSPDVSVAFMPASTILLGWPRMPRRRNRPSAITEGFATRFARSSRSFPERLPRRVGRIATHEIGSERGVPVPQELGTEPDGRRSGARAWRRSIRGAADERAGAQRRATRPRPEGPMREGRTRVFEAHSRRGTSALAAARRSGRRRRPSREEARGVP